MSGGRPSTGEMNAARPAPEPTIDSRPYWDGLKERRLLIQQCGDCGTLRHYPRPMCAACHSLEVRWIEASRQGRLYSWTEVHHPFVPGFRDEIPYVMATVELEEGVRLQCQMLDAEARRDSSSTCRWKSSSGKCRTVWFYLSRRSFRLRAMPDLSKFETLIGRLAEIDFSQSSEQDTREIAVNTVIGELGWDTLNRDEVAREHSVRGGRVDYCLRTQARNLVLIEVKRAGTDLTEHQEQLLRYAFDEGVPLAVLTDGLVWWLYLPTAGGSWEQRRFFRVNFCGRRPADAAGALHRFLNRDGVVSGEAQEEARREFESQERDRRIRAALQDAWHRVLGDPGSLLRDLLAEAVEEISGHQPDRDTIADFLQGMLGSAGGGGVTSAVRTAQTIAGKPTQKPDRRSVAIDDGELEPGRRDTLPIELDPSLESVFLKELLRTKRAWIVEFYRDGRREERPWEAPKMSTSSNVVGNLRSRPRYRAGAWQRLGIVSLRVSIEKPRQAVRSPEKSTREPPQLRVVKNRPIPPVAFWLDGVCYEATTWRQVLIRLCALLAKEAGPAFEKRVSGLRGRTRHYFSTSPEELHDALPISDSRLYVEGNVSAILAERIARRTLREIRGSEDGFRIEMPEASSD